MNLSLQQLATLDALLSNWGAIRVKMMPLTPALAKELNDIGRRLKAASTAAELALAIDDLLDLVFETPAETYVKSLLARNHVDDSATRSANMAFPGLRAPAVAAPVSSASALGNRLIEVDSVTGVRRVQVYFATNRLPDTVAAKSFSGDFQNALTLGTATVTVPVDHNVGNVETPGLLGDASDQSHYFTLSDVEPLAPSDFSTSLEKAALRPSAADLLIFLHGFNVSFEEAAMRAAQFAVDSNYRGLVVLFSWPSKGELSAYAADEERAAISGDVMMRFLSVLEGGPWPSVHFLAHSMGNRVLLLGLADNPRPKLPMGQLVFAAADVYDLMFDVKFAKLQANGLCGGTSYASKKDRALLISSQLHMAPRVGLVEQIPYTTQHLTAIDATNATDGGLGHGYWSAVPALLTDLNTLLTTGQSPGQRKLRQMNGYWTF